MKSVSIGKYMNIVFVIDMIGAQNNGTTITAMRTAKVLKDHGHQVRFIGFVPKDHSDLSDYDIMETDEMNFGPFNNVIHENGMILSKISKEDYPKIRDFIKDADVVHLLMPFHLESQLRVLAKSMNIAVTSAMHVQPENVSYNIGLGHIRLVNSFIYWFFRHNMYRYTRNVHTPSMMMKDQMIHHHYTNDIFPISNGVSSRFVPAVREKPEELKDKFVILMIGRFSGEKRQDLIIKAIGKSKYNSRIQLILCGQGPLKKKLENLSDKYLKNPCLFKFVNQDQLYDIINYSDLYIHSSDAESEAIACIEAFSCGKVPIISDSKVSATNHFAKDERCLFKAGDPLSLRDRIDYFIEHPEVIKTLSPIYVEYGETFVLDNCVKQLEDMFEKAIYENQEELKGNMAPFYSSGREKRKLEKARKLAGI